MASMEDFVQSEPQLLPGVFHFFGSVPENMVDALLDFVETAFPASKVDPAVPAPPSVNLDAIIAGDVLHGCVEGTGTAAHHRGRRTEMHNCTASLKPQRLACKNRTCTLLCPSFS